MKQCNFCKSEYKPINIARQFGKESAVYRLGFCSARCYTDFVVPKESKTQPEQPPPQSEVANLAPDAFAIITRQLGLPVTIGTPGFFSPYQYASIHSPVNGELLLVLVAPVVETVNVTVHDKVGNTAVTIHDQI